MMYARELNCRNLSSSSRAEFLSSSILVLNCGLVSGRFMILVLNTSGMS